MSIAVAQQLKALEAKVAELMAEKAQNQAKLTEIDNRLKELENRPRLGRPPNGNKTDHRGD